MDTEGWPACPNVLQMHHSEFTYILGWFSKERKVDVGFKLFNF